MMNKFPKILLFLSFAVFLMAGNAWGITYTGSLTSCDGMVATGSWDCNETQDPAEPGATLSWEVDNETQADYWTYVYTWTGATKDLSHIDIEVSENFIIDSDLNFTRDDTPRSSGSSGTHDLISWNSDFAVEELEGPQLFSEDSTGGTVSLYGIKWGLATDTTDFTLTLVSTRAPMWGDFYAKDGTEYQGSLDIYAYNAEFGNDTEASIENGNAGGWVLVPDTTTSVPEPATMLLLGSGLIGLAVFGRKKIRTAKRM